ncbi:MAG: SDR family oxidoreductase [Rhodobacteraceae bacterium]|nr:SDR family oxidoreductase [Paracoccaceae bacterium]
MNVLITGGASGIGRAMAQAFSDGGATVWVSDVDAAALGDLPANWHARVADVADEDAIAALMDEVGPLDTLCANAGITGPTALVEDIELKDWNTCQSVTLNGAFLSCKHAIPAMKAAGRGAIILTSSTAGQFGFPNRAPYAAAKWGVIGLMKTLAMELGPFGIRANAICPGAVEGPRMEGVVAREAAAKGMTPEALRAGYAAGTSLRSWVRPEDVAAMAVFLASDAAARVSGQVIAVDGHTENPDPKV